MAAKAKSRRQYFKSFEAKSLRSRSFLTQIADTLTEVCGSTSFLFFHVIFFTLWILVNTRVIHIPGIPVFDPYPFSFLTLVVSLEAIFLSIFVLVSQNRSAYISTIRDEVHLGLNLIAEEEITKILQVLAEIRTEMGIKRPDPELEKMVVRTDTAYLERTITEQLKRANRPLVEKLLQDLATNIPLVEHSEHAQNIATEKRESK